MSYVLLFFMLTISIPNWAQTQWTGGAGNSDWHNADNWTAGIPAAGSNVIIQSVTHLPVLNTSEAFNDLTINSGASLTIGSGQSLTLQGNFTNEGTFQAMAASKVIFSGVSDASVVGGGTIAFQQLVVSKTSGAKLILDKEVILQDTATIETNATLELTAGITFHIQGVVDNLGNFIANNVGSTLVLGGATKTALRYNDFSVYNLTLAKTAATPATNEQASIQLKNDLSITVDHHLQLNAGRIVGSQSTQLVIIGANATTSAPNADSFIEGRVRKIKGTTTSFVFPIGKNGRFGRLAVTGLTGGSATDHFTAEYFGTSFNNSIVSLPLNGISNKEYWRLQRNGSTTCKVELYWENGTISGINGPNTIVTLAELRVAQWNTTNAQWENRGVSNTTGNVALSGSIESNTGQGTNISAKDFWSLGYNNAGGNNPNRDWNTTTWVGTANNDWHNANNWSPAAIPSNSDQVVILGDRPNNPSIGSSDAQVSALVLSPNISPSVAATNLPILTIDAFRTLTVGNDASDGTLNNSGIIINNGSLNTRGQFNNNDQGVINNNLGGTIAACTQGVGAFDNGTSSTNTAIINDAGTIRVREGRRFDNNGGGIINNLAGGVIISTGHFRNRDLAPNAATIVNNGLIQLLQDFQNDRPLSGTGTLEFTTGTIKKNSTVSGTSIISQKINISKTNNKRVELQTNITATNDITIPANGGLQINTGANLQIEGNFTNNGTLTSQTNSTITFSGNTQDSQISGTLTGAAALYHLVVNKEGGFTTHILSNIELNGDLTNQLGTLEVDGSHQVTLHGSLHNNDIFTPNNSHIYFVGNNDVTVQGTGSIAFYDVTLNSSATNGVTLESNIIIDHRLTFTQGYLNSSAAHLLILGNNATANEGNANSYVRGPIRKIGTVTGSFFVFPVGKADRWARLALKDFDATSTSDYFTVEYFNTSPPNRTSTALETPLTNLSPNEYWNIERGNTGGGTGSVGARISLHWEDRIFSQIDYLTTNGLRIAHYNSNTSQWENKGQFNLTETATTGNLTTTNIQTSFSPWTFGSVSSSIGALPVSLLSFDVKVTSTHHVLTWQTINETHMNYFEVQKSNDGVNFTALSKVNAQNKAQQTAYYQALDSQVCQSKTTYYRLKMVEPNTPDQFSPIIAIQAPSNHIPISTYPNPFLDKLRVTYFVIKNQTIQLSLYNASGNLVLHQHLKALNTGVQQTHLNTLDLQKGIYILKVKSNTNVETIRLIK